MSANPPVQPLDAEVLERLDALTARSNLIAWCIVPFDGRHRTPAQRAEMLAELGFRRFAYDWRDEHVPTFDAELDALTESGIELTALWCPVSLDVGAHPAALDMFQTAVARGLSPRLWVCTMFATPGEGFDPPPEEDAVMLRRHVEVLGPLAEQAAEADSGVSLYNHGGWFGEPAHQIWVINELAARGITNAGLVYNLHHGHHHAADPARWRHLFADMAPHLDALTLNGTVIDGERMGRKIVPFGHGERDLDVLAALAGSGWLGPIALLGHTDDDAAHRLADNLDGLAWATAQLRGDLATPRPAARVPL